MNDVITLVAEESRREVFCGLRSVTRSEFYQAQATGYKPEMVFVLADYLDYNGETLVIHGGQMYRVLRTYRTGQELELTVTRASLEEAELYGE